MRSQLLHAFPIRHRRRQKQVFGFQTGDIVKVVKTVAKKGKGKKAGVSGVYVGRVLVRATGSFDICTQAGRVQGVNWKSCQLLQYADGYNYNYNYNYKEGVVSSAHLTVAASTTQNL